MILKLLISIIMLLQAPKNVFAHGNYELLTKDIDKYTVESTYDPLDSSLGLSSPITFYLKDKSTNSDATYQTIWVKITQGYTTVFSAPITKPDIGPTSMMFRFPKEGDYNLNLRFQNEDKFIAEASFPLKIISFETPKEEGFPKAMSLLLVGITSLVVGLSVGFFVPKMLKTKK